MTSLIVEKDSRYYQYRVLVDGKTVLATTMEAELAEDRTLAFALGFYHESWNSQRLCIGFPIGTKDETLQRIISAVRAQPVSREERFSAGLAVRLPGTEIEDSAQSSCEVPVY